MPRLPSWVFLLTLVIFGSFYVGLSTDFLVFAKGAQQILYALSGRNSAGNFVAYPSGAPTTPYNPF